MLKRWIIPKMDAARIDLLSRDCGLSRLSAQVLAARGCTTYREAADFWEPGQTISSPFDITDMEKAAKRILSAVDLGERIVVYGDYDCDGVTATAILYTYLQMMGADVGFYIPEREGEGYGLNRGALKKLADEGTQLIVTVDNGISALDEADYARALGMELVITDHHQPGDVLPDAVAVVDPHRQDDTSAYQELCGAGVALKLCAAMDDDCDGALERFAELAAIGTVGDVVPLTGENRIIVQQGLRTMACTEHPGLIALCEAAGRDISRLTSQDIAFAIAPRINAAGRMGSAKLAFSLLVCEDEEEAAQLARQMCVLNQKRQETEQRILDEITAMLEENPGLLRGRLLILRGKDWSHGVIGIVCARLMERYGKPVLLMSADGDFLRGSARSIGEFHLFKALSANSGLLTQYGGHKLAAGFSLKKEDFPAFCAGMERYAAEHFDLMPRASLSITGVLTKSDLSVDVIRELSVFEPFGARNEAPVFLLQNARIETAAELSGGKHLRLSVRTDGKEVPVLCFNMTKADFPLHIGDTADIAVTAGINEFKGVQSVSLKMADVRPAGFSQEPFFNALGYYEKLVRREAVSPAIIRRALPEREEAAAVYRYLRAHPDISFDAERLCFAVGGKLNYCKLNVLLDILKEAGLISLSADRRISLLTAQGKTDLTQTATYRRLSSQI